MKGINRSFTDNNLKVFYANLLRHYKEISSTTSNITEIYNALYLATQHTVEAGPLSHLFPDQKQKVYLAFSAIFYALPVYKNASSAVKQDFKPVKTEYSELKVYVLPEYYHTYNDNLTTWLLLSNLVHDCHHFPHRGGYFPAGGSRSSNTHSHTKSALEGSGEGLAALAVILIAAALAALALIAMFYLLHELLNSAERVWHNEGWLKAGLMLCTSVVLGGGAGALTMSFVAVPLAALAITAGFNPVAVVAVAGFCIIALGAALACLATSLIYDYIQKKNNPDAMDPSDPNRYGLTESQERDLIGKGIDPFKVKCAIVALRAEMSKVKEDEKTISSYLFRHFGKGKKIQPLLDEVRQLRKGIIDEVTVGDLHFDCKYPLTQHSLYNTAQYREAYAHYVQEQLPPNYHYTRAEQPSAPPEDENLKGQTAYGDPFGGDYTAPLAPAY